MDSKRRAFGLALAVVLTSCEAASHWRPPADSGGAPPSDLGSNQESATRDDEFDGIDEVPLDS